mmetsp:Transcript_145937/g.467846  ORF Transcript_145937/g.467846 Transcript_145937/m.467846 type:complete len:269 (+) Transcript_145937:85-891(+)
MPCHCPHPTPIFKGPRVAGNVHLHGRLACASYAANRSLIHQASELDLLLDFLVISTVPLHPAIQVQNASLPFFLFLLLVLLFFPLLPHRLRLRLRLRSDGGALAAAGGRSTRTGADAAGTRGRRPTACGSGGPRRTAAGHRHRRCTARGALRVAGPSANAGSGCASRGCLRRAGGGRATRIAGSARPFAACPGAGMCGAASFRGLEGLEISVGVAHGLPPGIDPAAQHLGLTDAFHLAHLLEHPLNVRREVYLQSNHVVSFAFGLGNA